MSVIWKWKCSAASKPASKKTTLTPQLGPSPTSSAPVHESLPPIEGPSLVPGFFCGTRDLLFRFSAWVPHPLLLLSVRCGGRSRSLQQLSRILSNVAFSKYGVARHEQFRSGAHHVRNRIHRHAAIHFNPEIEPELFALVCQRRNFLQRILDELLPTESG